MRRCRGPRRIDHLLVSRRELGVIGVLTATLSLLGPSWLVPANATEQGGQMPGSAEIVIHKLVQPEDFGDPASGLPQEVVGTPISGVTFTATPVPGVDLSALTGQVGDLAEYPLDQAIAETQGLMPSATSTTDGEGVAILGDLAPALYLVSETSVPSGVVLADPFLVLAPMPHDGSWLDTIHVYPKNSVASVSLAVFDESVIDIAEPVRWQSTSSIPLVGALTRYQVANFIDPSLVVVGGAGSVQVQVPWGTATATEYTAQIVMVPVGSRGGWAAGGAGLRPVILVDFTAEGLANLDRAQRADPGAKVQVSYQTVMADTGDSGGDGIFRNEAVLAAGSSSEAAVSATVVQVTKFGPLTLQARDRDNRPVMIPGVRFQMFASAEDAASRRNPLTIRGREEWTTDEVGQVMFEGLRFSDFANGADQPLGGPLSRPYFAAVVAAPSGWKYSETPLSGVVQSTTDPVVLTAELWKSGSGSGTGPEGGLPVTGTALAGTALLAGALIFLGAAVLKRKRGVEDAR